MFSKHYTKAEDQRQFDFPDRRQNKQPKPKRRRGNSGKREPGPFEENGPKQQMERPNKRKKTGPSEEALLLSAKLKELSRNKNLDAALKEYWDSSNDSIRDGHHACIMVDCSARCGKISVGEEIIERLTKSGKHVNVETKTALIKGYVHSGEIAKAESVFLPMCECKAKSDLPNIRTLNTLLRGCLWSAASIGKNKVVTGGVVTSEKAWALYKGLVERHALSSPDISSYEYSITLLCQALKTKESEERIEELKNEFGVSKDMTSLDQSVTESLSLSYLGLARAYAILSNNAKATDACKNAIDFAILSKEALEAGKTPEDDYRKRGKNISESRLESNTLYRGHRLSEFESEAKTIKDIVSNKQDEGSRSRELARRLLLRLLVFSGGGTTDLELANEAKSEEDCSVQHRLVHAAYFNYGLDIPLKSLGVEFGKDIKVLRKRDCNRILGSVGLQGGIIDDTGLVDFRRLFNAGTGKTKSKRRKKRILEIELGSGFGDWVVKQAMTFPEKDYLAVELRADRVGQTFARSSILSSVSPLENLCSVGAESGSLLLDHVAKELVSTIYINHPEPPTQTFGAETTNLEAIMSGGDEPAHMLCSRTLVAAAKCLTKSSHGKLVIVTDNHWYGRLICATFVRIARQNPNLFQPVDLSKHHYEEVEAFPVGTLNQLPVIMYEGQPGEAIGHAKLNKDDKGSSYFDRLWRSGAGSHAEKRSRFVIVMSRNQGADS
ncbi:unnamed protein product [Cylindrotheca closterium]|uniref:tRNA (guanine(46)-N(7))-methyltransferase n=1 Tax=Cylindrotheca closterium TaxID=2856 RepID=A0AAD2CC74_9STRA|nr:unnamed protein product [Cylindrotheca closterium]